MKHLKVFAVLIALITLPFLSKAQKGGGGTGGNLYVTVTYHDAGYGTLTCTAVGFPNTYTQAIASNSGLAFGGPNNAYSSITFAFGGYSDSYTIAALESQTVGTLYYYHYVPKSPSGTAPIYSIVRNGPLDYTLTTYSIPL